MLDNHHQPNPSDNGNNPKNTKVPFVCVQNSCRSQMAEAFARALASDTIECFSAGTERKPQINQDAVRLMKQVHGIDMSEQYSKLLEEIPVADVYVSMGCNVQCPRIPGKAFEDWGLDDPTGQPDEIFLQTMEQIRAKVLELKERLERC